MTTNQDFETRRDNAVARAIAYSSTFVAERAENEQCGEGSRAGLEIRRRHEQRGDERRQRSRQQPQMGGKPGEFGVGESLRDEYEEDADASDEVGDRGGERLQSLAQRLRAKVERAASDLHGLCRGRLPWLSSAHAGWSRSFVTATILP